MRSNGSSTPLGELGERNKVVRECSALGEAAQPLYLLWQRGWTAAVVEGGCRQWLVTRNRCVGESVPPNVTAGSSLDVRDARLCAKPAGGEESWDEWMDGSGICAIMSPSDLKRRTSTWASERARPLHEPSSMGMVTLEWLSQSPRSMKRMPSQGFPRNGSGVMAPPDFTSRPQHSEVGMAGERWLWVSWVRFWRWHEEPWNN